MTTRAGSCWKGGPRRGPGAAAGAALGIFFKSLTFIYLFVVLLAFSPFGSLEKSASRSGSPRH
ncbi:hypothetical protein P4114_19670 [Pseudomonas aeruginosa]|nr:hypothetical protein [Pseudomonas aeruginosa]